MAEESDDSGPLLRALSRCSNSTVGPHLVEASALFYVSPFSSQPLTKIASSQNSKIPPIWTGSGQGS